MSYIDKDKLRALFKWYMQEVGNKLVSVLIVDRDGLVVEILTKDQDKTDEKKFIGAFSSLVELILRKITQDFDIGTFGAGTFDTDKYRFIFCESGSDHVLVSILHPADLTLISQGSSVYQAIRDCTSRVPPAAPCILHGCHRCRRAP